VKERLGKRYECLPHGQVLEYLLRLGLGRPIYERHLASWMLPCVHFYQQELQPRCIDGLGRDLWHARPEKN
jgi:hypothetical protein